MADVNTQECSPLDLDSSDSLQPEDIPGSTFKNEEIGKLSVVQLKFWLKCRKMKVTGKKNELLERVRNLNDMPEIRDKVYDPDPNKSYTMAKIEKLKIEHATKDSMAGTLAGTSQQSDANSKQFPTDDSKFNKDFSVLPAFVPTDTLVHVKQCGKTTRNAADDDAIVDLSSSKGLRLMPFVHNMEVSKDEDSTTVYLRALCWASYRKGVKYKVMITINTKEKPKIKSAKCDNTCPAGKSGCCCHVMAVIWKLDEMTRNKQLTKPQAEDTRTCTSKPRKWGIPGKREVTHEPVMTYKVFKPRHQTDTPGRKRRGVLPTFYDPRPMKSRKLDPIAVMKLRDNIRHINPHIPFAKMTPDADKITLVDTVVGPVAKGSVIHLQLKDYNTPLQCSQAENQQIDTEAIRQDKPIHSSPNNFPIISPPKQQPVSLDEIKERCQRIKQKLFVDKDRINEIEKETRGQSDNPKWFQHRLGRITASKCHRVGCNHRASTSPTKIIKDTLSYNPSIQTKAMKDGLKYETLATEQYAKRMHGEGHAGLKVESCGFFISNKCGIIGAPPDGLVTDPTSENPQGSLEIKNIGVKENESLLETMARQSICNKHGVINLSHKYYYQIQQNMYVLNRPWCDFVVRGSNNELFCKRVEFNTGWWDVILNRLTLFYDTYILPELAYPRVRDGLPRFSLD